MPFTKIIIIYKLPLLSAVIIKVSPINGCHIIMKKNREQEANGGGNECAPNNEYAVAKGPIRGPQR